MMITTSQKDKKAQRQKHIFKSNSSFYFAIFLKI
jgi:hypothetical protein